MAKPRVFISSTYYDLKYVRSSLELFVESLGFEAILSEKGDVPYSHEQALDESCYREVQNSDIYVLLVGGRYGSEVSTTRTGQPKQTHEQFESITKTEYKAALERDIPIFILIERSVYAEYRTFLKNKDNESINYAHVDSINVFRFIEEIDSQKRNNPIQAFDRYSEIEEWLRTQWAGIFRDLLHRASNQQQIATLAAQVANLSEVNNTLRRYLEQVIEKVSPEDAANIIKTEQERLKEAQIEQRLKEYRVGQTIMGAFSLPIETFREIVTKASTIEELSEMIMIEAPVILIPEISKVNVQDFLSKEENLNDLNVIRTLLGLLPFDLNKNTDSSANFSKQGKSAVQAKKNGKGKE